MRKSGERKTKKSTETVVDEEGNPLFHIINFEEGGFVVVSADYRAMPVIAFNDTEELLYERDKGINGLAVWFEQSKDQLKEIKKSSKGIEKVIEKAWKEYLEDGFIFPTNKNGRPTNQNCQEWYTVGQFMCQNHFSEKVPL